MSISLNDDRKRESQHASSSIVFGHTIYKVIIVVTDSLIAFTSDRPGGPDLRLKIDQLTVTVRRKVLLTLVANI